MRIFVNFRGFFADFCRFLWILYRFLRILGDSLMIFRACLKDFLFSSSSSSSSSSSPPRNLESIQISTTFINRLSWMKCVSRSSSSWATQPTTEPANKWRNQLGTSFPSSHVASCCHSTAQLSEFHQLSFIIIIHILQQRINCKTATMYFFFLGVIWNICKKKMSVESRHWFRFFRRRLAVESAGKLRNDVATLSGIHRLVRLLRPAIIQSNFQWIN